LGALKTTRLAGFLPLGSNAYSEHFFSDLEDKLLHSMMCAAELEKSPLIVGKNGKMVRGAGRPLLPGTMPAKYVCATIIAEVISFFVKRGLPKPSMRTAYKAAERYWMSWPLGSDRIRSDPTKAWSRYFEGVDEPKFIRLRAQVRTMLTIRIAEEMTA
jgi:hypothetical protein